MIKMNKIGTKAERSMLGVDKDVTKKLFDQLPMDMQQAIIGEWISAHGGVPKEEVDKVLNSSVTNAEIINDQQPIAVIGQSSDTDNLNLVDKIKQTANAITTKLANGEFTIPGLSEDNCTKVQKTIGNVVDEFCLLLNSANKR